MHHSCVMSECPGAPQIRPVCKVGAAVAEKEKVQKDLEEMKSTLQVMAVSDGWGVASNGQQQQWNQFWAEIHIKLPRESLPAVGSLLLLRCCHRHPPMYDHMLFIT